MEHDHSPDSDADLLSASLEAPELFGDLYDRYAGVIHRFVARRLGWSVADDLTADVFLVAFRSRQRFDNRGGTARPWLYGIANNLVRKHRREEVRALLALGRTGADPLTRQWAGEATDAVEGRSLEAPLASALAALAARDRDVLLLIAWADLAYEEVAQALRIPVGTVRSRLNRARSQVRRSLAADAQSAPTAHETRLIPPVKPREAI